MIRKNSYLASAAIGAAAILLAAVGGYWARASAETGAVNALPAPAAGAPASFADIIARVAPAVVSIEIEGKLAPSKAATPYQFQFGWPNDNDDPFGFDFRNPFPQIPQGEARPQTMHAAGSGFFVSPDGYVLTNNHVVQGADKITVHTKDGRELTGRLVGTDPATDLAVVKVDGGAFPYVSFEDRAKPRVGDWVVAVGNPFGLGGTATAGIVSALGRRNAEESSYVDYMQIDAPINRGNSGGPTFDMSGRVVGVNTAIFTPSGGSVGIGFDIPADVAAAVSHQLIEHGKVVRGYVGAVVQDVTPEIADSLGLHGKGALIADLTPGGPSARAGLQPGDVVVKCDGRQVNSAAELTRDVALARVGETVRLEVLRDGRAREIDIRSGVRPTEAALEGGAQGLGPDASPDAVGSLGMGLRSDPNGGVAIAGVDPNSDAADKGLRAGDLILQANGHKVVSPSDVYAAVAQARREGRKDVLLLVSHNGQRLFMPLKVSPKAES
jgi:serine protease Do